MIKKFFYSLIYIGSALAYDTIDEALQNGISNGDVVLYGSNTSISGVGLVPNTGSDLNNNGYVAGSIGLAYRSGFYKTWRFMVSFRAAQAFFEANENSVWLNDSNSPNRTGSVGDASKDFYSNYRAMLGQSYLEYFDGDTSVRTGRIFAKSEWADRLIDGVYIRNKSLENTLIEVFWAKSSGYVQYNKMTGMYAINPYTNTGLTNVSIQHTLWDLLSLKVYGIFTPSIFNAVGFKASLKYEVSNSYMGVSTNFTTSFEGSRSLVNKIAGNGFVFDIRAFLGVKDFIENMRNGLEVSGGYIMSGTNGIGSLNIIGNNVSPFFMWGGKAFLLGSDVALAFGKINFSIDRISLALVYGSTRFHNPYSMALLNRIQGSYDRVNEVNVLLEFGTSEHSSLLLNVLNTHGGDTMYYPHTTAVNLGVKLAF
ncbi:hypothetical protein [Helicobacter equorum]|uniref:hypothetical protein n=1 Tax=Helicobacter equorum TaxID=361872 RepID=UPI000CF0B5DA|nr:hypothetical protein [Helicobacter equorum]